MSRRATVVLDIGKTNVKLTLLAPCGDTLAVRRRPNSIMADGPYPHHDTERIWGWMLGVLQDYAKLADIGAIVPVTHGATAALVDDLGLVLPVLDYELALPAAYDAAYRAVRPPFTETFSPELPAGLNLGRQLHWLAHVFPEAFASATHILAYPQYWAWRLCGVAASEVTSLGCHTDLWNPVAGDFSTLVERSGWQSKFPPLTSARAALGALLPELAALTGLPASCQVLCGIHDSNASLLRYLAPATAARTTVLSTGTWVIAAALGEGMKALQRRMDEKLDMLVNVNASGQPVPCIRFMGGREFSTLAGPAPQACSLADIELLIRQGTMALPCFADAGGPFVGRVGAIAGPAPSDAPEHYALATLYCALMTDFCLDALGAGGPVMVEGSFTSNPWFGALLAALRAGVPVSYSQDENGTTCGAWLLHHPDGVPANGVVASIAAPVAGLDLYRDRWRALLDLPSE